MQSVFLLFALSITTLAILHGTALTFSLYWVYLWLDIPMHFLGGAAVALGYQSRFLLSRVEDRLSFGTLGTVAAVVVIGGAWEVYEYLVGPLLPGYAIDTTLDLVMDVLGGVLGYGIARGVSRLDS